MTKLRKKMVNGSKENKKPGYDEGADKDQLE
jgi:hypothetical protein